jgi:hypothetical protein
MKITDLLTEDQQLDEIDVGKVVGKAARGLAKGAGAVAGGIAGIGKAFKSGYSAGKEFIGGTDQETDDTSSNDTDTSSASAYTPSTSQTTPNVAVSATPVAQPAATSLYSQVKQEIDQLDTKGKQAILAALQKTLPQTTTPAQQTKTQSKIAAQLKATNPNNTATAATTNTTPVA